MGSTDTFGAIPQIPLTPPLTPDILASNTNIRADAIINAMQDLPLSTLAPIPELHLDSDLSRGDEDDVNIKLNSHNVDQNNCKPEKEDEYLWREDMTDEERDRREEWLASSRGRKGLRIVVVTGTSSIFNLPKHSQQFIFHPDETSGTQKTFYLKSTASLVPFPASSYISNPRAIPASSLALPLPSPSTLPTLSSVLLASRCTFTLV